MVTIIIAYQHRLSVVPFCCSRCLLLLGTGPIWGFTIMPIYGVITLPKWVVFHWANALTTVLARPENGSGQCSENGNPIHHFSNTLLCACKMLLASILLLLGTTLHQVTCEVTWKYNPGCTDPTICGEANMLLAWTSSNATSLWSTQDSTLSGIFYGGTVGELSVNWTLFDEVELFSKYPSLTTQSAPIPLTPPACLLNNFGCQANALTTVLARSENGPGQCNTISPPLTPIKLLGWVFIISPSVSLIGPPQETQWPVF
eukprot:sb/3468489/